MAKKHFYSFEDIIIKGWTLDNCDTKALTFDNVCDIKTILAYAYEDGKHWHDSTCVMEIIFHNFQENIQDDRIRICYEYPSDLLAQFSQIMFGDLSESYLYHPFFQPGCPVMVKMDLPCSFGAGDYAECGIKTEDFDEFNCTINHKKRFYSTNPDMPFD